MITGLSHNKSSVVSRKSLIFEQQNSKSAQTFRGVDPPMHHLSRAIFSSRLAQGCGYAQEITVFVFLKTFFLRRSSYVRHKENTMFDIRKIQWIFLFLSISTSNGPISELTRSWKEFRSSFPAISSVPNRFLTSERSSDASGKSSIKIPFFCTIREYPYTGSWQALYSSQFNCYKSSVTVSIAIYIDGEVSQI